nr:glycosyltransferase family A protein [uncultured Flavobacterium sp.]
MINPKVSIIVPCYNQAQYLPEALQSVLNQTYQNWECIIVNDGSPDNTKEVAQEWVKKDSRFIYLYKENGGLSSARNAGITIAEGEFVLPLDADDKIALNYTELAIEAFEKDSTLKVVYCKAEKFGNETGSWNLTPFSLFNLASGNLIFCSAFFRKKDWELVGGYDVNMIYGFEDWEFWVAMLKNGGGVKCLDYLGFYYRIKLLSMAKGISLEEAKFLKEYVSKKHIDFILANYDILNFNRNEISIKLKSKKFVINLFTKMFFGVKFFTIEDEII